MRERDFADVILRILKINFSFFVDFVGSEFQFSYFEIIKTQMISNFAHFCKKKEFTFALIHKLSEHSSICFSCNFGSTYIHSFMLCLLTKISICAISIKLYKFVKNIG